MNIYIDHMINLIEKKSIEVIFMHVIFFSGLETSTSAMIEAAISSDEDEVFLNENIPSSTVSQGNYGLVSILLRCK